MSDNVTTQTSPASTLPPATIISAQQQTDTSLRQNVRVIDGTKDSTYALAIDSTGAAKVQSHAVTNAGTFAVQATSVASEVHVGEFGGAMAIPSANFTRPADTTQYASGDLVANSTTAGSVTPLSWSTAARVAAGSFMVRRARLKTSSTSITTASFRLHIYAASPTVTNGDNGVWLSTHSSYLGAIDITVDKAFSDAAAGTGQPLIGTEINHKLSSGQTIYGLLEARSAYTPTSAEVFTVELELLQN